jgi:uncharacterized protein
MIPSVFKLSQHSIGSIWLPVTCILVAFSSHTVHAATPNVNELLANAERGSVDQEIKLAEAYLTGNGVAKNAELATYWYEKAAQSGNPEAQNLVGQFYQDGVGVPVDPVRAFHWYQLAAASGSSDAFLHRGVAYAMGLGVKKNESLALEYLRLAVDKGNGTGAAYLGILTYIGFGGSKDVAAAERWLNVGEKLHDPISAYNLGLLYSTVPDHPHDAGKAAKFLRQASEAGYIPAVHALALHLIKYPQLAKSPGEPRALAESAAEAGFWKSSVILGIAARDGIDTPVDSRAAYYHFKVATLQNESAERLLAGDMKRLSAKLGPNQVNAIDSEANSWFRQHNSTERFVHIKGKTLLYIPNSPELTAKLQAGLSGSRPDA